MSITTALARSRRTLRLKWERKSRTNTSQVEHNSHTQQHNTRHAASVDSVSFWPWNIKDNSACRTLNVMFYSHLFLNRLFIMNIHKRYATLASSLEVYMFMGQAILLTLKREALVSEVLVLNVGHERWRFSDWCWRRIPHGGSKRSINKLSLHTHIHSSGMQWVFMSSISSLRKVIWFP